MAEYTLVAVAVLAVAAMLAGLGRLYRQRSLWIGLAVFAVLTAVFDVLLTRVGVYAHRPQFNSGILFDRMPIEDLLYGIALYLMAVVAWSWAARGKHHAR